MTWTKEKEKTYQLFYQKTNRNKYKNYGKERYWNFIKQNGIAGRDINERLFTNSDLKYIESNNLFNK